MPTADRLLIALMMTACSPEADTADPVAAPTPATPPAAPPVKSPTAQRATPRLLAPADPAGSVVDIAAIQGRWQVVGVAIADGPVQAFTNDDPAYMGQVFTVAGKTLAWEIPRASTMATLDDVCRGGATMRLTGAAATGAAAGLQSGLQRLGVASPDPHEVACLDGGNWGGTDGGALFFPIDVRTLAMRWYDNVILKLRWQAP